MSSLGGSFERKSPEAALLVEFAKGEQAKGQRSCGTPLDAQTSECLWAWKDRSPYPAPGDWVFASPHMKGKQPYWPGTLWRYYAKPALKRAGIVKHVSYHTFRHTFGTLLNANGENPKVVQELLCHASLKVTTGVYMQAVGPQKREAQSNLVRLVRKGFDSEAKSS